MGNLKDHLYFLKITNLFFLFVESINCFGCCSNADTRTKIQASTDLIAVAFGLFNLRQRIVGISTELSLMPFPELDGG